jgi:hypothetical protein
MTGPGGATTVVAIMRKAVAIGVNQYETVSGLRGCVNDVTNLGLVLEALPGFTSDQIRVLSDESATKRRIEEHIDWLVDGASAGDLLVLHFSGHGSRVPDAGAPEEPDGLDEILCPYDMAWSGAYITDDDLRARLVVPDGVVLEVILDACHTGDANVEFTAAPASDPDRQPRFLEPPASVSAPGSARELPTTRFFRSPAGGEVVLWSACAASQTAADARINGLFSGAFTFYFCKHVRESQGNLTRQALLARVRASLSATGFSQVPELAAPDTFRTARPFQR